MLEALKQMTDIKAVLVYLRNNVGSIEYMADVKGSFSLPQKQC
jgi:hypothetical protein